MEGIVVDPEKRLKILVPRKVFLANSDVNLAVDGQR
jgi:hypothetical protein